LSFSSSPPYFEVPCIRPPSSLTFSRSPSPGPRILSSTPALSVFQPFKPWCRLFFLFPLALTWGTHFRFPLDRFFRSILCPLWICWLISIAVIPLPGGSVVLPFSCTSRISHLSGPLFLFMNIKPVTLAIVSVSNPLPLEASEDFPSSGDAAYPNLTTGSSSPSPPIPRNSLRYN